MEKFVLFLIRQKYKQLGTLANDISNENKVLSNYIYLYSLRLFSTHPPSLHSKLSPSLCIERGWCKAPGVSLEFDIIFFLFTYSC